MRIGFDLQLDEAPLFLKMAEKLYEEHGVRISGITLGKRWNREIRNISIKNYSISEFIKQSFHKNISLGEIESYVHKYGRIGLNRILSIDRFLSGKDYKVLLQWVIGHLRFYEYYFDQEHPDFFVGPGIAFLSHLAAYLVGKVRGAPYLAMMQTRIPNNRFAICRNLTDTWDAVKEEYSKLNKMCIPPSEHAKAFIRQFREKPIKPSYMTMDYQKNTIRKAQIKKFLNRLILYYVKGWGREEFDYYTHSPFYYVHRDLLKIVKSQIGKKLRIFTRLCKTDKFVFFPLHLQPEASTSVLARFYVDQISTVENIAKCIPLSHLLYVKEHSSALGTRKKQRAYYKRISSIPAVRLIHPEEDTQELIKHADAIVTLSSTVGWEALLHGKPVITLGDVFYNDSELTLIAKSYDEIEEALIKILLKQEHTVIPEIFETKLGRFVDAIFRGTYMGNFDVPGLNPEVMKPYNIDLLIEGLMAEIKRRQ